jgi:hypothetical protein
VPGGPGGDGENGHGTAVLEGDLIRLVYQERAGDGQPWRICHATVPAAALGGDQRGHDAGVHG